METVADSKPATTASRDHTSLYVQVDQYPWDSDAEFQSGLAAILGTNSPPDQANELNLRARCFYYSRKFNTDVDFNAYKAYLERGASSSENGVTGPMSISSPTTEPPQPTADAAQQGDAPYPVSFAEIVELIQSGKPIPGIKEIPSTVLEGKGTEPAKARRKKPWEKDDATTETTA